MPVREYVAPDPFVGLPVSGPPDLSGGGAGVALAEFISDLTGRGYRTENSVFGSRVVLTKPSRLPALVRQRGSCISDLRIIPDVTDNTIDAFDVANIAKLRSLSLGFGLNLTNSTGLLRCSQLERLTIEAKLDESVDISNLPSLREAVVPGDGSVVGFGQSSTLGSLRLNGLRLRAASIGKLTDKLNRVEIESCSYPDLFEVIGLQPDLIFAGFYRCSRLSNLKNISRYRSLTHLVVEGARQLVDVTEVAQLDKLQYVEFRNCPRLQAPLALPRSTQYAFFMGSTKLDPIDAERLRSTPGLRYWRG